MLDLPHYRCNNVYVPWLSTRRDERCSYTYQSKMVRANALGFVDFRDSASRLPSSIANAIGNHLLDSTLSGSGSPLRISTEIGSASSTSQRKTSMQAGRDDACNPQNSSFRTDLSESRTLYDSPKDVVICDGWCGYDIIQHATVLSLSACVDLQRAWEGPRGSLTAVLCRFLEKHPNPSYRTLMSHVKCDTPPSLSRLWSVLKVLIRSHFLPLLVSNSMRLGVSCTKVPVLREKRC